MQSCWPLEFKLMSSSPDPISQPNQDPTSQPTDTLDPKGNSPQDESISSVASEPETESATSPEDASADLSPDETSADDPDSTSLRPHPIPPPSEPLQYRAIGLVRGKYTPLADQFTQGTLLASDGTEINAVLLGRVMSLVRKHIDLEQEHLWVVYPRTREQEDNLHMQIVGVWEPENLSSPPVSEVETTVEQPRLEDGYFSIRGEAIFYSQEKEELVVKIRQAPRKTGDRPKSFKLKLKGGLEGRPIGYFWDLHVQRQGDRLVIQEGTSVAQLPSKRRKKPPFKRGGKGGGGKPRSQRPTRPGDRSASASTPAPQRRDAPLPKPLKRKKPPQE